MPERVPGQERGDEVSDLIAAVAIPHSVAQVAAAFGASVA
jgi:hypothetical protein